jgi:hypothetical protein
VADAAIMIVNIVNDRDRWHADSEALPQPRTQGIPRRLINRTG